MIAVTLTVTPAAESSRITGPVNSRLVFMTGILTLTFFPHEAMALPWRIISGKSSAKTSRETGRSGTAASNLRAKDS